MMRHDLLKRAKAIEDESTVAASIVVEVKDGVTTLRPEDRGSEFLKEEYGDEKRAPRGLWRRHLGK